MGHTVIGVKIGGAGAHVGGRFYNTLAKEHGIDGQGKFNGSDKAASAASVFFRESEVEHHYVPRAVVADMEENTTKSLENYTAYDKLPEENKIAGNGSSQNNFAKGYCSLGKHHIERTLSSIRKEMERSSGPVTIQITHSLGGGTGSGFTSLLLDNLGREFPQVDVMAFTVLPSAKVSDVVVEPYNSILALPHLMDRCKGIFLLDNGALFDATHGSLNLPNPTFGDLNQLISFAMAGVTAPMRFCPTGAESMIRPAALLNDLAAGTTLSLYSVSACPLTKKSGFSSSLTDASLVKSILADGFLSSFDPWAKSLSSMAVVRGTTSMTASEIQGSLQEEASKLSHANSSMIKAQLVCESAAISEEEVPDVPLSCTSVHNSPQLGESLEKMDKLASSLWKTKAFFHWYENEGVSADHFEDCRSRVRELIAGYKEKA